MRRLLVGVLAGACLALPAPSATSAPLDGLFVEGDSLTVGSSTAIKTNLAAEFRTITVDAEVGRSTPTGISRLNAGQNANVWVVALGTNDAPDPVTMRRNVKAVLARAGTRPVLWVSVWRSPSYSRVNRMLSRLDRKSAQLAVLRWDRFIAKNPQLLAGDRIHLTPAGYEIRGRMIADAVRSLLGQR
jgi:lysophospholipase L1-like esterase